MATPGSSVHVAVDHWFAKRYIRLFLEQWSPSLSERASERPTDRPIETRERKSERDGDDSGGRRRDSSGGGGAWKEEPDPGVHEQEAALLLRQSRQGIASFPLRTSAKLGLRVGFLFARMRSGFCFVFFHGNLLRNAAWDWSWHCIARLLFVFFKFMKLN